MFKLKMLNDIQKAYLAGIIDGEGCITIHKGVPNYQVWLRVGSTNKSLVEYLQGLLGGTIRIQRQPSYRHARLYLWGLFAADGVRMILREVLPYLIVKKAAAENALKQPYTQETHRRQKEINRKGGILPVVVSGISEGK